MINVPNNEHAFTINDSLSFNVLLMKIRGETIQFASGKNKINQIRENTLEKEIQYLDKELDISNKRDDLKN